MAGTKLPTFVLTGHEVYLIRGVAIPHHPSELELGAIPRALGNAAWEDAAGVLLSFSKVHDEWCAVGRFRLQEKMREGVDEKRFDARMQAIATLLSRGFIAEPIYRSGLKRVLNFFQPKVLYPTPRLIKTIWAHQHSGRPINTGSAA